MGKKVKVKKIKKLRTPEDIKKRRKLAIIITASVVAAIFVTGLVLGLVPVKSMSVLSDYKHVEIKSGSKASFVTVYNVTQKTDENKDAYKGNQIFSEGLTKTKYSILRGMFEGTFSNKMKFEKDSDGDKVEIASNAIETVITAEADSYALTFYFDRTADDKTSKCIEVEGKEIKYDAVKMLIAPGSNEIKSYKLYFYDTKMIYGEGSDRYVINPVVVKARTTVLHEKLGELFEYYNII